DWIDALGMNRLSVGLCALVFFFFQAEDGIRGGHVTGVQTCALPISATWDRLAGLGIDMVQGFLIARPMLAVAVPVWLRRWSKQQIGRASCRERVKVLTADGRSKNKSRVGKSDSIRYKDWSV